MSQDIDLKRAFRDGMDKRDGQLEARRAKLFAHPELQRFVQNTVRCILFQASHSEVPGDYSSSVFIKAEEAGVDPDDFGIFMNYFVDSCKRVGLPATIHDGRYIYIERGALPLFLKTLQSPDTITPVPPVSAGPYR